MLFSDVVPFSDAAAFGTTAVNGDMAVVGDMVMFIVTYEMHACHPEQYICTLHNGL